MVRIYSSTDAFIGLICKYVLAPISRFSGVWGIPVITPGGLSEAFNLKVRKELPGDFYLWSTRYWETEYDSIASLISHSPLLNLFLRRPTIPH